METQIELGDIVADVVFKNIKNIHLSVYPPNGRVRISAPSRMDIDTIRIYAISKLGWIKKQQEKQRKQERETQRSKYPACLPLRTGRLKSCPLIIPANDWRFQR